MIIDIHTHLMGEDLPSKAWWDGFVSTMASLTNKSEEKVRTWIPGMCDTSGDMLVKDMDEAGIDISCVLVVDSGLTKWIGEGKYSIEEQNRIYADAARRHPGRIIAFFGVDPRRANAVQLLEKCVKECGMKGMKLMPASGWYPDDKTFYPLYQKADELGIPVLFHIGPETFPNRSKYCRPTFLDEVAVDFPNLKIIGAHCGYCWWEEAAWIASYKPNIYLDLASWQPYVLNRPLERLYKPLRSMLDTIGTPKILFGSDWPTFRQARRLKGPVWVNAFKEPPDEVKAAGIEFTEQEINAILGGNAAKLLGLT